MKLNSTTNQDYSNMFEVENTTHAVPRFRGAHVSQSGAPKGDPHRFQCYNTLQSLCVQRDRPDTKATHEHESQMTVFLHAYFRLVSTPFLF